MWRANPLLITVLTLSVLIITIIYVRIAPDLLVDRQLNCRSGELQNNHFARPLPLGVCAPRALAPGHLSKNVSGRRLVVPIFRTNLPQIDAALTIY